MTEPCRTTGTDSIRILLSDDHSDRIRESGHRFLVAHPASTSAPGRMNLDLLPVDYALACQILDVIAGKARIVKKKLDTTPTV